MNRLVLAQVVICCVYGIPKQERQGQQPNLFDDWADTNLHLLLIKSSMDDCSAEFETGFTLDWALLELRQMEIII